MVKKTIVCLANSFRKGGSCVAGVEWIDGKFGEWIRPISHREDHAISDSEKTYTDGTKLALLDLVEIEFDRPYPSGHQTENWLIKEGVKWKKIGVLGTDDLDDLIERPEKKLWASLESTKNGRNDVEGKLFLKSTTNSLCLVRPETAKVSVCENQYSPDRKNIWVEFSWAGKNYKLKLTDPDSFRDFEEGGRSLYEVESPTLCISLAEVFRETGKASKLVASLIN